MTTATTNLNFMGADFQAKIELTITAPAIRQTFDDPGWGPEFDIESITLREERSEWNRTRRVYRHWLGPPFEATGALFQILAASRPIDDAILEAIAENSYFEDYDDRDYSDRD